VSDCVLDASALLALVRNEPGANRVQSFLAGDGALISAVNLAEVWTRLLDLGLGERDIAAGLSAPQPEVVPFDESLVVLTARLRSHTRHLGLSLGDRACLALALSRGLTAVTADRLWAQLNVGVTVEVVR
jgi:PIN domain nuclease of toxin-antitoxin system